MNTTKFYKVLSPLSLCLSHPLLLLLTTVWDPAGAGASAPLPVSFLTKVFCGLSNGHTKSEREMAEQRFKDQRMYFSRRYTQLGHQFHRCWQSGWQGTKLIRRWKPKKKSNKQKWTKTQMVEGGGRGKNAHLQLRYSIKSVIKSANLTIDRLRRISCFCNVHSFNDSHRFCLSLIYNIDIEWLFIAIVL